jgi:hypothetical protein
MGFIKKLNKKKSAPRRAYFITKSDERGTLFLHVVGTCPNGDQILEFYTEHGGAAIYFFDAAKALLKELESSHGEDISLLDSETYLKKQSGSREKNNPRILKIVGEDRFLRFQDIKYGETPEERQHVYEQTEDVTKARIFPPSIALQYVEMSEGSLVALDAIEAIKTYKK